MLPDDVSADDLLVSLNQFLEKTEHSASFRLRVALEVAAIELAKLQSSGDGEPVHRSDKPSEL